MTSDLADRSTRERRFVDNCRPVRVTVLGVVLSVAISAGPGCSRSQPQNEAGSSAPKTSADAYQPPPEGTASLVQSLTARRDPSGQLRIVGRLLLPGGTRIWVELFPTTAGPQEQLLGRSELYLDSGGMFEAGPFNLRGPGPFRVLVTAYFSRSWQPDEVLRVVGVKGIRLPKSALKLDPRSPQSGGHLEYSTSVTVAAS